MAQFRVAHLLIKAWAKSRGMYSAKFGLLGGVSISVLLVPICKHLACNGKRASTADVIATFFAHYADLDWKTQMVFDPFFHKDLKYHRTFREALCLLGWHAPSLNTSTTASVPTVKTIAAEFKRATSLLSSESVTWDGFLGLGVQDKTAGSSDPGAREFVRAYRSYLKIDAHFWGSSPEKGSRFVGWLESRCVMLLVEIDRKAPNIMARIWPARFVEGAPDEMKDAGGEYHGCYLVGLEWDEDQAAGPSKELAKKAYGALQNSMLDFETRIRGDQKYYDDKCCWVATSLVRGDSLDGLELDQSQWGQHAADTDDDDDTEDDLSLAEDEEEDDNEEDELWESRRVRGSSGRKKVDSLASRASSGAKPPGLGKFRTAADVLSRLRWDGNLNSADYIVGYEDRFKGAQEKAVGQWKSEQTDEEFIPQHRILYFKRKSDKVIVWERRSRIDDVFGSGIKAS
ncbi:hypothetical protein G7046_g4706 [Stylonectria norvegica]|nr:hypothetical protein G7046_g4706 [Stylonectria norvegica]